MTDPKLSEFVADVARSSDDKAEWYEQQAWRMVARAEALEAVAEAARRVRSFGTRPPRTMDEDVERYEARQALNAALDALDGLR